MCVHIIVHNTAQNSSDYFPSYKLQTIITAQMVSIGGKGIRQLTKVKWQKAYFTQK